MNALAILNAAIEEWMHCYGITGAPFEIMEDEEEAKAWLHRICHEHVVLDMRTSDGKYYPCLVEAW